MSAQLASRSAAQQHAVAYLAYSTVTGHDTLHMSVSYHCRVMWIAHLQRLGRRSSHCVLATRRLIRVVGRYAGT
jgi:hypothetical protein